MSSGMMDKAYFVGKRDILSWINTTLQCNVEKVEDAHAGWVYCQVMDACFPGVVPLHRVNFNARTEYEKLQNLKILQDTFAKCDIKRGMDPAKLVKGKFQDNMEFCQWLKHFHGVKAGDSDYPAVERRNDAIRAYSSSHKHAPTSFQQPTENKNSNVANAAPLANAAPAAAGPKELVKPQASAMSRRPSTQAAPHGKVGAVDHDTKIQEQTQKIAKLRLAVEGLEKERDFYFAKLRDIEVLCQETEDANIGSQFKEKVLAILYKTDDEDFVAPQA